MDIKKYFTEVREKLAKLSDDEFEQLLIDSGIENCPYEDEIIIQGFECSNQKTIYQPIILYYSNIKYEIINDTSRVA